MKNLVFASLLLSTSAIGQKKTDTLVYPADKVVVSADTTFTFSNTGGFMVNGFWDNWFVSAGIGEQIFFGNQDYLKPWSKRFTPTYDLSVGKWILPVFGIRAKVGGGPVKGYSNGTAAPIGHSLIVGGPDASGVYTQKWHQLYAEVDLLFDLTTLFRVYDRGRFYSLILSAGVGFDEAMNQPKHDGDRTAMAAAGLINRFRINGNFDANLELRSAFVNNTFDREVSSRFAETFLSASIGITYRITAAGNRLFRRPFSTRTAIKSTYDQYPVIPAAGPAPTLVREPAKEPDAAKPIEIIHEKDIIVEKKINITHPMAIFFELNQSTISDRAKVNLSFAADVIKASEGTKFRLIGSADSRTASPKYNEKLSLRRSNAVRDYLVKVLTVDPEQLIVTPIGGSDRFSPARVNRAVIVQQEQP